MKLNKTALVSALTLSSVLLANHAAAAPAGVQVNYVILQDSVALHINKDGSYSETVTRIVQPLTTAGVAQMGHMQINYPANFAKIQVLEAYTETTSNQRKDVPASQIFDQSTPIAAQIPFLSDGHVMSLLYPAVTPGAQIHLKYTETFQHPYLPGVYAFSIVLAPEIPAKDVSLSITAPQSMNLYYNARGDWHKTTSSSDGMQTLLASGAQTEVSFPPENTADITQYAPMVTLSTVDKWEDLAKAYNQLVASGTQTSPMIKALALKIADGASGEEAVARIYRAVQKYINTVPVDYGDSGFTPPNVESTMMRGVGDSNATVTLFCAFLNALGIKAVPAMISDSLRFVPYPGVDPFAFDHFLAYIPAYHLFLDPSEPYAGMKILPAEDQGRPVLITGETPDFTQTPGPPPGLVNVYGVQNATLEMNGDMKGESIITSDGLSAVSVRQNILGDRTGRRLQRFIQNSFYLGGTAGSIKLLSVKNRDDLNKPVEATLQFEANGCAIPGRKMAFMLATSSAILGELSPFTSEAVRSQPSVVQPITVVQVMNLRLPTGMVPEQVPDNQSMTTPFGNYSSTYKFSNGVLSINRRLQLTQFVISPQDYPELHKLALLVVSGTREAVVIHDETVK